MTLGRLTVRVYRTLVTPKQIGIHIKWRLKEDS